MVGGGADEHPSHFGRARCGVAVTDRPEVCRESSHPRILGDGSTRPQTKCSDQTIRPRHAAIKTFSHKYVLKELKLTKRDLLEDVERFEQELPSKEELGADELARVRASFNLPTFEHVRDRAIFEIHMATA